MDLPLLLDSTLTTPLYQQLYEQLRQAILQGRLRSQQRLPSTRSLAKSLGISRLTVTQGYDWLLSEGYLETRPGAGTYVCQELPDTLLKASTITSVETAATKISLSAYGERVQNAPARLSETDCDISFRYGRPALDLFPTEVWRTLLSRHCRAEGQTWMDYAPSAMGYAPLRAAIAAYLGKFRAVQCQPEQILITNGTQQALELIVRLLVNPTDGIAMEDPGYLGARSIFQASGAEVLAVPCDRDGLVVDNLSTYTAHPRLVYLTPSHQFPTGALLSLPRRLALLKWAHATGALIIEDDYDSEYRYSGRPIPALQGLDTQQSVLYIGTFSKVMFPSLRIGYLVLPPALVTVFSKAKGLADRQSPSLTQCALADFIHEGHLERHIRRMRTVYARRRQALVKALYHYFGDTVEILGDSAGLHIMARLSLSLDDNDAISKAQTVGVAMFSARPQYWQPMRHGEFVFGYAELDEATLIEGVRRVATVVQRPTPLTEL
ncbi:MAG: PLP-dependent aminotransferase family protein [Cyanobacteria bacterium P01_D01_bin.44]